MIKITMKKRNKRMRLKGSQGVERESCMVSMWAFSKSDRGGWERGSKWWRSGWRSSRSSSVKSL